jgi:hypothetical protein
MLAHYSHVRLDAKPKALDALAKEEVNANDGIQTGVTSRGTSQIRILSLCHSRNSLK